MAETNEWVISRSREYFSSDFYESKAAAIAAAPEALVLAAGATFYVGRVEHVSAPLVDAEDVAEILYERVMDDVQDQMAGEAGSEAAEGYPRDGIAAGVRADVLQRIAEILTEALPQPAFYLVHDAEAQEIGACAECKAPVAIEAMNCGGQCAECDPHAVQPTQYCHANRDGDCRWEHCPQVRDGEPEKTGRHCPLDTGVDDE